jgi:sodium-independent sulfate anion transporter 11
LIDVRNQLDRYAAPDTVDWHFCHISSRWTKRALAAAGFGYYTPEPESNGAVQRWKPIFSVAEIGGSTSAAADSEARENRRARRAASKSNGVDDVEEQADGSSLETDPFDKQLTNSKAYGSISQRPAKIAVVQGLNRPLFHVDITAALNSALANAQRKSH